MTNTTQEEGLLVRTEEPELSRCQRANPIRIGKEMISDAKGFVLELNRDYGWRFVVVIATVYLCCKGLGWNALTSAYLPYYVDTIGVTADQLQRFTTVSSMAWSMKPLIGIFSDRFALFGYHKRYYALLMCTMSATLLLVNTLIVQHIGGSSKGTAIAAIFFMVELGVAGTDLMMESRYSAIMNAARASPAMVSFVWICYSIGSLVGSSIEGPMADAVSADAVMWVAVPFLAAPIIPIALGWIPEKRVTGVVKLAKIVSNRVVETSTRFSRGIESGRRASQRILSHGSLGSGDAGSPAAAEEGKGGQASSRSLVSIKSEKADPATARSVMIMGMLSSCMSLLMAIMQLLSTTKMTLMVVSPVVIVLIIISFRLLPRMAAIANLFMFMQNILYLQIVPYLNLFYTSGDACIPGGPNFSFSYYQTLGNVLGSVGQIIGSVIFQRYLSNMTFMRVFWVTTTLKIFASAFDFVIAKRLNIRAGINDHFMYVMGDAIIYPICTMLDFMPATVLLSRACPPGLEATMYALMAGFANFGASFSQSLGSLVAEQLGIYGSADGPCNFDKLWLLIVICHMILPLGMYMTSYILMPDVHMKQTMFDAPSQSQDGSEADETDENPSQAAHLLPGSDADTTKKDATDLYGTNNGSSSVRTAEDASAQHLQQAP